MYVVPSCRPEVAHCVGILARALTFPTPEMLTCAQRVIAWLARHPTHGMKYDGNVTDAHVLVAYSDSDWGIKPSTTGWYVQLAGAGVSWRSARQHSVATSTTEAEIIAASDAALEVTYLRGLLAEMGFRQTSPTVLYVDNSGAVELSRDLKSCQRSRHIERRYLKRSGSSSPPAKSKYARLTPRTTQPTSSRSRRWTSLPSLVTLPQ